MIVARAAAIAAIACTVLWLVWRCSYAAPAEDVVSACVTPSANRATAATLAAEATKATGVVCDSIQTLASSSIAIASLPSKATEPKDAHWPSLPRRREQLWFLVSGALSDNLNAERLLRNKSLNPRDIYIPTGLQAELRAALDAIRPKLDAAFQARMTVYNQEFAESVDRGLAVSIGPPVLRASSRPDGSVVQVPTVSPGMLRDSKSDMYVIRDGKVLVGRRSDMAFSRMALDEERFLEIELASAIVSWFQRVGTITAAEAETLLVQVARRMDR